MWMYNMFMYGYLILAYNFYFRNIYVHTEEYLIYNILYWIVVKHLICK